MCQCRKVIALLIAAISCAQVVAAEDIANELNQAKNLRCIFNSGVSTQWEEGREQSKLMSFDFSVTFTAIDMVSKTASAVTEGGVSPVSVLENNTGVTFTTSQEALTFTTVFPYYKNGTKEFIAVHSRHSYTGKNSPHFGQYHGTCTVL